MSYLITKAALYANGDKVKLHDGRVVGQTAITVTVVGGKFALDGSSQVAASLLKGNIYYFDQSDSTNGSHPLRFSETSDGTHGGGTEYTTGVTTGGTPGSAGAYTQIDLTMASPDVLYYYCSSHSGMGGSVQSGSVGVLIEQNNSNNRVGIGTASAGFAPSHKLDVNGDIRIRGNDIRDNSGTPAITFDGSGNVSIPNTLTANSIEQTVSTTLEHTNACFDLGSVPSTAKQTTITAITIPANATVTAIKLETTEAFAQNSGTPSGQVVSVGIGTTAYELTYNSVSGSTLTSTNQFVTNSTTPLGFAASRQAIGGSSVNPTIRIVGVTNDPLPSDRLTDGTLTLTIFYVT